LCQALCCKPLPGKQPSTDWARYQYVMCLLPPIIPAPVARRIRNSTSSEWDTSLNFVTPRPIITLALRAAACRSDNPLARTAVVPVTILTTRRTGHRTTGSSLRSVSRLDNRPERWRLNSSSTSLGARLLSTWELRRREVSAPTFQRQRRIVSPPDHNGPTFFG